LSFGNIIHNDCDLLIENVHFLLSDHLYVHNVRAFLRILHSFWFSNSFCYLLHLLLYAHSIIGLLFGYERIDSDV